MNNNHQQLRRGDICYIHDRGGATGSEMQKTRPAIVVSNDTANLHSPVIEVVYLTSTSRHNHLPCHVALDTGRPSTAMCEQVYSVDRTRVGNCLGRASHDTMRQIDRALLISLGITADIAA